MLPPDRAAPDDASRDEDEVFAEVVLPVEMARVALVSIRVRKAWRTSSRAVASCRIAGPLAVVSDARMEAGAEERMASASGPVVRAKGSW